MNPCRSTSQRSKTTKATAAAASAAAKDSAGSPSSSDGTSCGTECAQRVLGRTLNPKSLTWIAGTTVIAEHTTKWETAIVYQAPGGRTLLAINGYLQTNGGGLQQFERLYGTDR